MDLPRDASGPEFEEEYDMRPSMVSAAPAFAARTSLVAEMRADASRPDRVHPREILRGRDRGMLLASLASSLFMMLMVVAAGVGIARTSNAGCPAEDAATCVPQSAEWCKSLKGEMLCPGEPT
jgi:hypothetical protein